MDMPPISARPPASRSPHGERGLKSHDVNHGAPELVSLSSWRAWIEIMSAAISGAAFLVALLMESVD